MKELALYFVVMVLIGIVIMAIETAVTAGTAGGVLKLIGVL